MKRIISMLSSTLTDLSIDYCRGLTEEAIAELVGNCKQLEHFSAKTSASKVARVTDKILLNMSSNFTRLRTLNIRGNDKVTDEGMKVLQWLTTLTSLDISGTSVTSRTAKLITKCIHLQYDSSPLNQY